MPETVGIGSLCTGYGGLDMAVRSVLGGNLAWVADCDPGASRLLAYRYPDVPNLGDISAFDWDDLGDVDVITAGFPCQDLSAAGARRGLRPGTRSGVWESVVDAIWSLSPRLVFIENVRGILSASADSDLEFCPGCMGDDNGEPPVRALGAVLGDLAGLGFDAEWISLPAAAAGAPHRRERVFILAWPVPDADGGGRGADKHGLRERRPDADRGTGPAADPGHGTVPERARDPGREGGQRPPVGQQPGRRVADASGTSGGRALDWGPYGAAVARWEAVLGRPAPCPTEPWKTAARPNAAFVEWMMGLPGGWVTEVPDLNRNAQLRLLGNGVVPQQGALALQVLLGRASPGWLEVAA